VVAWYRAEIERLLKDLQATARVDMKGSDLEARYYVSGTAVRKPVTDTVAVR
jgi:hypothetical protein